MNEERKAWIERRVDYWIAKAGELYGRDFATPTITYHDKNNFAGLAMSREHKVSFHKRVIDQVGDAFDQTIGHEVAHLVASAVFGCRGHGKQWKAVMRAFGLPPTRCTIYGNGVETGARKHKRVRVYCACATGPMISLIIRNRMLRGRGYRCRTCKTSLTFERRELASAADSAKPKLDPMVTADYRNIMGVAGDAKTGFKVYVRGHDGYFFADDLTTLKAQLPVLDRKGR